MKNRCFIECLVLKSAHASNHNFSRNWQCDRGSRASNDVLLAYTKKLVIISFIASNDTLKYLL